MGFDHRKQHTATGEVATHRAPVPGKQTLTDGLVQRQAQSVATSPEPDDSARAAPAPVLGGPRPTLQMLFGVQRAGAEPDQVHAAAARGTATAATQLPHLDAIQRSFGRHDISGVQAHVGAEATASARDMGAQAYATGHHVVLGDRADLHTVAHEAAHVVQQRGGVQLKGGVGETGDAYEQHADRVADAVVQGKSAEGLLDQFTTQPVQPRAAAPTTQRMELVQRKDYGGTTVGVEQELTGHKLVLPDPNDRGVIGYVSKGSARLVEFTSDMGGEGIYTIELRTTPCEKDDAQAVQDRKNATAEMLRAIEEAGQNRNAVPAGVRGEFKISILRKNHKIELSPYGTGFANQASIGIQTDQLMTAGSGDKDSALLMKYARWYSPELASELPPEGLEDPARAKRVYAMVGSTISFLAGIVRSGGPNALEDNSIRVDIYDPQIKNRWGALPRTPPWEWLEALKPADGTKIRDALRTRFQADPYDKAAFTHISTKQDLAGHPVPASTIKGKHSSVFEFRDVPNEMKRYLHGGTEVPEEAPAARPAMPANLLAALRGGPSARRARTASDNDG